MSDDARFEDAAGRPLRLVAIGADDLEVLSSLVQDAVFLANEMKFERARRRFAILLHRFRWEDDRTPRERVRAVLSFDNVLRVRTSGIDRTDRDTVLSLLAVHEEGDRVILTLAGDGAIALDCGALDVSLRDVTRPWRAVSGKVPRHPD